MKRTKEQPNRLNEKRPVVSNVLIWAAMIFASLITIIPMIVVFFGSFKSGPELLETNPLALPQSWNFTNYIRAWNEGKMLIGFINTFIILIVAIALTILTGTMTAYVLNRFNFRGKKLVKGAFLLASLIPSITMQMSVFQIIVKLGVYDTRWATILLFAGTDIISIYIFLQFMESISPQLDEAAILDGASFPRVYFSIILPLLKPAIVTVIIIKGIAFYNDFYTPYLYMKKESLAMISTSLYRFQGPYGTQWEIICAAIVITMIPTLIIFLSLQKQIYGGLTNGAVKE